MRAKPGIEKARFEFVRIIVMSRHQVPVNVLLDLLADGKHRVRRVQEDLQSRLVRRTVSPGLQNDETEAKVVALVYLPVHDEVVHLGVFQSRLVISGHQNAHMGDAEALSPLPPDVVAHNVFIHIVVGPVLGIISVGHDIGKRLHDGAQALDTCSVRSHGSLLTLS